MNLIVDQGNTQFKAGIFNGSELIETYRFNCEKQEDFKQKITGYNIERILISSVVQKRINLDFLKAKVIEFHHKTKIPILNNYLTPNTLGLDRLANAVGAWQLNKNSNNLIIDLGTCIKYDIVSESGSYLGGNISPGLQMRFKALNHYTDQLPILKPRIDLNQSYGTDTESSIQCGVIDAIKYEIDGFISCYAKQFNQLTIFMTGGDLKYFEKTDKKSIFAHQNLTLVGLNEILKHNA